MTRSERSIIKGMQQEHDRLIERGRQLETQVAEVGEQAIAQIDLLIANHNRVHPCTLCNSELRKLRAALEQLR